jgi:CRISPR-associated endonuclease/helicase Cas3
MSSDLTSFSKNFFRLTGYAPMRWQQRLFDQFKDGAIPQALDLPTGLGKTSVMAIWLTARALANGEILKAVPRRLIYVVDRRAVVDQATEEAEKLRNALESDAKHLKDSLGLNKARLPISTLRGAYVDNREWLDDPAVPAIVVGTVDMIGSRLLFSGYGVSRKMRPYQAGLLGADALVVLDEAHLVPPFEALLSRIANGAKEFGVRCGGNARLIPPFVLLSLSATGRAQPVSSGDATADVFSLEEDDLSDQIVQERLFAKKTLNLVKISDEKDALAEALARRAWVFSGEGQRPVRCLVYADSREVGEKTKEKLDSLSKPDAKGGEPKAEVELFVGARRMRERENARAWLQNHGFLAGSSQPAKPAFLIATSAGEVGIDLDADHMACDLVPWERMVQRLGRVNRRGKGDAKIVVLHGDEPKPKKSDAPTAQEMRAVVGYRSLAVLKELPERGDGKDASPGALRKLKLRAETDDALSKKIEKATTPEPLRPALTRALVDAWSMTSLEQHTGRPEIAPWLRGWIDEDIQTTVIWRTHLPVREGVADWPRSSAETKEIEAFFEAAPPHESEKLETETWRVADWLQARAKDLRERKASVPQEQVGAVAETSDADPSDTVPGEPLLAIPKAGPLHGDDVVIFVLLPDGSFARCFTLKELAEPRKGGAKDDFHKTLVNKTLIVDVRFGGLHDGMLDAKGGDIFPTADADDGWNKDAGFRVRRVTSETDENKEDDWRYEHEFVLKRDAEGQPYEWLLVEHYKSTAQLEDARSVSRPQELAEHQSCAEQKARDIAVEIGLPNPAVEALSLAALVHDEGKRARLWQQAFKASRDAKKFGLSIPLAKTEGPPDRLDGYRHEFGSLAVFEPEHDWAKRLPQDVRKRIDDLPEDWRDLVLHLIAAHHGFARPIISKDGCEDAPPSALQGRARDVALRFARLQKRWGPWGLAWWEALLRAADQQASRKNEEHAGDKGDSAKPGEDD